MAAARPGSLSPGGGGGVGSPRPRARSRPDGGLAPIGLTVGGAVLAGGASRRMGRDKAFVRNRGEALVTRACRALEAGGAAPVLVVGGDRERVEGLGLAYVEDRYTKAGPLGGIITALEHLSTDLVVVLACDHLYPSARAVRSVVDAIGPADVAVPMSDGRAQWLHAVWRTTALPSLIEHYRRGVRAPRLLAEGLDVVWAPGGEPRWYRDADRPEDLPPEGAH